MNYLFAIKTAILFFPIIAFLFTLPFILSQYHRYGSIHKFRVLIVYSFILYLLTIYFLVILPLPSFEEVLQMEAPKVRLIPFTFIMDIIRESSFQLSQPNTYLKALCEPCIYTVVFNLFMTIPFGMYLRYYFKCDLKKTIKFSFLLSLFFELTQLTGLYFIYPKAYRVFDVDDLIINTLGGVCGYYIMPFFKKVLPSREEMDKKSLLKGTEVSGLRRITLFCLDCFLFFMITVFFTFISKSKYIVYFLFILYYAIIPYFWNGKTFAGNFLNVRIEFPNKKFIRLLGRAIFNYFYYFVFCFLGFVVIAFLFNQISFSTKEKIGILFLFSVIVLVFYILNIFIILIKKRMYYDLIFKTEYVSTIMEKEKKEENRE